MLICTNCKSRSQSYHLEIFLNGIRHVDLESLSTSPQVVRYYSFHCIKKSNILMGLVGLALINFNTCYSTPYILLVQDKCPTHIMYHALRLCIIYCPFSIKRCCRRVFLFLFVLFFFSNPYYCSKQKKKKEREREYS